MKRSIKTALCTGVAAVFLYTGGSYVADYSKRWVDSKINDAIVQYEKGDKQWTDKALKEGVDDTKKSLDQYATENKKDIKNEIGQYEQKDKKWTKQNFETKISLERLMKVFDSTYLIMNNCYFKTSDGQVVGPVTLGTGSGILLKGGYFLTAHHVTDSELGEIPQHPLYGPVEYSHSEFFLTDEKDIEEAPEPKFKLEKIVTGTEELDYTLLKLEKSDKIPFYDQGLNMPNKVDLGMQSVVIGFPVGTGKNLRLGNVSQLKSDAGEDYYTFKNSLIPGDSGGPIFVVENGELKLVALTRSIWIFNLGDQTMPIPQIANINHGLKIKSIVKDVESKLKSGSLDEKTAKEVKNFLKLNKK